MIKKKFDSGSDQDVEKVSYGVNIGGGIGYQLSKLQIGLKSEYLMSLNKIHEESVDIFYSKAKNKTIMINAFLVLRVK